MYDIDVKACCCIFFFLLTVEYTIQFNEPYPWCPVFFVSRVLASFRGRALLCWRHNNKKLWREKELVTHRAHSHQYNVYNKKALRRWLRHKISTHTHTHTHRHHYHSRTLGLFYITFFFSSLVVVLPHLLILQSRSFVGISLRRSLMMFNNDTKWQGNNYNAFQNLHFRGLIFIIVIIIIITCTYM